MDGHIFLGYFKMTVESALNMMLFQGGRHTDYVADQIVSKLIEVVKKKNKAGVAVKPFQVHPDDYQNLYISKIMAL